MKKKRKKIASSGVRMKFNKKNKHLIIAAANRQTRMLADLALVNCYNKTGMSALERDRIMLDSAKRNLAGKLNL